MSKEEIITTIDEYIAEISFGDLSETKKEAIIKLWKNAKEVVETKNLDPIQLYLSLSMAQFESARIVSYIEPSFKTGGISSVKLYHPDKGGESIITSKKRLDQYVAFLKGRKG